MKLKIAFSIPVQKIICEALTIYTLTVIILTMNDELLTSHLCTALMRIGTRMATVFDQHFGDWGVTQAQFRLMLAVWEEGRAEGIAPSVLASHLLIERATISVMTQKMVERGLLERLPGENRRTFRLTLTKPGRELLFEVIPHAVTLAQETLNSISPAQLRELRTMLDAVEQQLRSGEKTLKRRMK